jgi:hypothetical protein
MPTKWIECGSDFISPDVLRWTEPIWLEPKRKSRKRKPEKIGERRVTAAVLELQGTDRIRLGVIKDEILSNKYGMPIKPLKREQEIVRKRTTLQRGKLERMSWLEESARAIVVSRFLG